MKICARCFGLIIGLMIGIFVVSLSDIPSRWLVFPLFLPAIIDIDTQRKNKRLSSNFIRLITGALFGIGIGVFVILWIIEGFH